MNRQKFWELLKKNGITNSSRLDCPPDTDLKLVIGYSTCGAKKLIDFLISLDQK